MNVYYITLVGRTITDASEWSVEKLERHPAVMVHGADNFGKAGGMLAKGMALKEVGHHFCGFCGNEMPCGCSDPYPQEV